MKNKKPFRSLFPGCVIQKAERAIEILLLDAVKFHKDRYKEDIRVCNGRYLIPTSDPDYSQAFGILQGLYMSKNMDCAGACNVETTPRYWFEQLENKFLDVNYKSKLDKPSL